MKSLIASAEQSCGTREKILRAIHEQGETVSLNVVNEIIPVYRFSPFSLSSNAARCSCARYDDAFFPFSSRRLVPFIFPLCLFPEKKERQRYSKFLR